MGIVENIKDAADLAKKVGDIELYRKIVHFEGEVMDLTRDKRQAEQELEGLEARLALNSKMTFVLNPHVMISSANLALTQTFVCDRSH